MAVTFPQSLKSDIVSNFVSELEAVSHGFGRAVNSYPGAIYAVFLDAKPQSIA